MTLLELAPYILGYSDTRAGFKPPLRLTQEKLDQFNEIMDKSKTARSVLGLEETPAGFFYVEASLKKYVKPNERDEFFYSMKNGFALEDVPAKSIYYILKAYNMYKTPNMIFKVIPDNMKTVMFTRDYLNGVTWRDVICSICDERYYPFDDGRRVVVYGDYSEIYVPNTDMCAVIPTDVARQLSFDDLRNVKAVDGGIKLGNTYLSMMVNRTGSCPTYDMRGLF